MRPPFLLKCYICDRTIVLVTEEDSGLRMEHKGISPRVEDYLILKGKVKHSRFPCNDCIKRRRK